MEPTPDISDRDAQKSNLEELLVKVLSHLSPADIIKSKVLEASFREFLERGTAEDCWRLVPPLHRAVLRPGPSTLSTTSQSNTPFGIDAPNLPLLNSLHENCSSSGSCASQDIHLSKAPPSRAVLSTAPVSEPVSKCHSSSNDTLSSAVLSTEFISGPSNFVDQSQVTSDDASLANSDCTAKAYFEAILGDDKVCRVQRLVRTIRGLEEAARLSLDCYERLWSTKGKVFEGSETGSSGRFCRLQRGRQKIKQGSGEYECASRLSLLFVANDVDHTSTSDDLNLSSGRGRKTIAFEELAKSSCIPVKDLKDDYKKSRGYMQLLAQAGPGSLLEVGSDVIASWEKNLTKEDISLVVQYRKARLPQLEERAKSLDAPAARAIVDGLLSYGWTYPDVLSIRSELMEQVKPYLDINKLANDMRQEHCGEADDIEQNSAQHPDQDSNSSSKKRCGDDIDVDSAKRQRTPDKASKSSRSDRATFCSCNRAPESSVSGSDMGVRGQRRSYQCNTMSSTAEIAYPEGRSEANEASTIHAGSSQSEITFNHSRQADTLDTCVAGSTPFVKLVMDRVGESPRNTNALCDAIVETEPAHHIEDDQHAGGKTCNPNSLDIPLTAAHDRDAEARSTPNSGMIAGGSSLVESALSSSAIMLVESALKPLNHGLSSRTIPNYHDISEVPRQVSIEMETQYLNTQMGSRPPDQTPAVAAETQTQFRQTAGRNLTETAYKDNQETCAVQQQVLHSTMAPLYPQFDDLWTSSFTMGDLAALDDMWNMAQIIQDSAAANSPTNPH